MKSYARFKKDLTEAVPLALLAPLAPKTSGASKANGTASVKSFLKRA